MKKEIDILKGLECCSKEFACDKCPYYKCETDCVKLLSRDAFILLNKKLNNNIYKINQNYTE